MVDLWIQNNTDDRCRITIMDRVGVHGTSIKDPSSVPVHSPRPVLRIYSDLGAGQTDSWRFGANSECGSTAEIRRYRPRIQILTLRRLGTIRIAWYNDNNKNRPDHIEVGCNMVG